MGTRTVTKSTNGRIWAGVPVVGICGVNGAGKTLLVADIVADHLREGRKVYSTVEVITPHGRTIPILSLEQILRISNAVVVLDEVGATFPSGSSLTLPLELSIFLQIMRHRDLYVYWTAPSWASANILLRRATQGVINVSPLLRYTTGDSPWRTPRLILAGLMDCTDVKENEDPKRILRRRVYRPKKLAAWGCYDTHADTPVIGHYAVGGRCAGCGGMEPTPKHSRERHEALGIPYYDESEMAARIEQAEREIESASPDAVGESPEPQLSEPVA